MIHTLSDLRELIKEEKTLKVVVREHEYFEKHREHLNYKKRAERGEPLGSGAVESSAKIYQVRFKRGGQFWSREHDDGLLQLKAMQLSG